MRAQLPTVLSTKLTHTRPRPLPSTTTFFPYHLHLPPIPRTLTTTPPFLKKGGKQDSKRTVSLNASKAQNTTTDPFDFSDYTAAIGRAHEHLKSELSKIKAGGRNAGEIEGLRVVLGKREREGGERERERGGGRGNGGGKREREGVKLGDVASVVARGRNVGVLVGEKDVRYNSLYYKHPPPNLKTHQASTNLPPPNPSTSNPSSRPSPSPPYPTPPRPPTPSPSRSPSRP